jgi:superfamily I DNA and/or RNA helicase
MIYRDVDRPPLIQGLPPLLFCDTGRKGVEKKDGLGFKNEYEAELTSQIITYMVSQGISGVQIGVIVFYKSQVQS